MSGASDAGASPGGGDWQPLVVMPLRDGGVATLWPDHLETPTQRIALAELSAASLVIDPHAPPAPPGLAAPPAVALRLRDGDAPVLAPARPRDAWALLDGIYARRPELRQPTPPPPPEGPAYGPAYGRYTAWTPGASGALASSEYTLAGLAHLSVFFAPIILPLILWLVTRENAPYASRQAKQAFFFHLIFGLLTVALTFAVWALVVGATFATPEGPSPTSAVAFFGGFLLVTALIVTLSVVYVILGVFGAVQAFQGKPFHYPLLGGL